MAFSNYKTIGAAIKEFQITYTEANFIVETAFNVSELLPRRLTNHDDGGSR